MFTLEWEIEGYETYWELDWCGDSFENAMNIIKETLKGYPYYRDDRAKIVKWVDGNQNYVWFFKNGVEVPFE